MFVWSHCCLQSVCVEVRLGPNQSDYQSCVRYEKARQQEHNYVS